MRIDVQLKLKENPLYVKFLRENSEWYKILNRDPSLFDKMISEMKIKYKMRFTDKLNNVAQGVDLISKFLSVTKD